MGTATQQTTSSTTGRLPNAQPNGFIPSFPVEISLAGELLGVITVAQDDFLSKKGNVLYAAVIKRGWRLPGEPTEVLSTLTFKVNGEDAIVSSKGVHLSAPRLDKNQRIVPNTGNEPLVAHFTQIAASDDTTYMVTIVVKRLHPKRVNGTSVDQGYRLRISAMPRAIPQAGPQVIGEFEGLYVTTDGGTQL